METLNINIEEARAKLEDKATNLRERIQTHMENYRSVTIGSSDDDKATEYELQAKYLSFQKMDNESLKKVVAAIARINKGEYGDCQRCFDYIEEEKLQRAPESEYCIECQKLHEAESRNYR